MKKFYLLLFSLILLSSCQVEESILPEEPKNSALKTVSIEMALSEWSNSTAKSMTKQKEEAYVIPKVEEFYYSDLLNSQEKLLVIPAAIRNEVGHSRIIMLQIHNQIETRIFTMYPKSGNYNNHFSGNIVLRNLKGEFIVGYRVSNGVFTSKLLPSNNKDHNKHSGCPDGYVLQDGEFCDGELDEVFLDGSSAQKTEYTSLTKIYEAPGGEGLDGHEQVYWYYTGGAGGTTTTPIVEEEVVNELKNPCGSLILAQLELLSSNYELPEIVDVDPDLESLKFSQAILNMFNEVTNTDYIVKEQLMSNPELSGFTDPNPTINSTTGKYQITTWLNSQYLTKATRLSTARSMIHESIHAYLVYHQRLNPTRGVYDLVNNYAKANGYPPNVSGVIHHNFMAQFVNSIAYNLKLWDRNHGTGGNLGWQYYHDLAWGGLANYRDQNGNILFYDEFEDYIKTLDDPKTLINESTSARSRILSTIENEAQNNSYAKGDDCP